MTPSFGQYIRFDVTCPGCGRRLSGLSEDARRARVLKHVRNCNAMKRDGAFVEEGAVPDFSPGAPR